MHRDVNGYLVLCPCWASAATLCYTTGPLDDRVDDIARPLRDQIPAP
jgi:hypothetical protein